MSKASDFHPKLSTLEIAKFQLLEQGFAGVTNGVTLVPAKDAKVEEAQRLYDWICHTEDGCTDPELYALCKTYFAEQIAKAEVAVLVVYRPGIEEGTANVQPIARMIDPWEVIEPEFAHTDGAGNVKGEDGGDDNNSIDPSRNRGNGSAR